MGKSTVDLPDPLQQPAPEPLAKAPPGGVDDLLAQMAGEEIDRLLAESELPQEATSTLQPVSAPLAAPASEPVSAPAIEAPQAPVAEPIASASDLDAAMTSAERTALDMPQETAEADAEPSDPFHTDDRDEPSAEPGGLPIYLKPLEWINAPLDSLPDGVRDAVGKIALLTFFNAAAVLIYVFVVRKLR
jgi:hypothetical protein